MFRPFGAAQHHHQHLLLFKQLGFKAYIAYGAHTYKLQLQSKYKGAPHPRVKSLPFQIPKA